MDYRARVGEAAVTEGRRHFAAVTGAGGGVSGGAASSCGRIFGLALAVGILLIGAACAGEAGAGSRWEASIDTIGDTIVVRTLSGGEWGSAAMLVPEVRIGQFEGADEYLLGSISGVAVDQDGNIYTYDRQVPALRQYGPDGEFIRNFGRSGGGPGEYSNSDGGLAVLEDGRIVLRDPGNARFQLYNQDGTAAGEWRYMGGFFTSTPLYVDTAGNMYSTTIDFGSGPPWKTSLVRHTADGQPVDTIPVPDWDFESPQIRAERGDAENRSISINTVPFSATDSWTFSPFGYFVGGVSTDYSIDLFRPDGVLRIGRAVEPIRVQAGEKANAEAMATQNMRGMIPDWRWNGPPIPDTKPPFGRIIVAQDGRIWVGVSQPGELIPEDERDDPIGPDGEQREVRQWREPIAFDVFEPDGRYVGMVRAPHGFSAYPQPVIRGDTVWAIVTDELGVQQIARMVVRTE
jgi:hypothetical protein